MTFYPKTAGMKALCCLCAIAVIFSLMPGKIAAASLTGAVVSASPASGSWMYELLSAREAFGKQDVQALDKARIRSFGALAGHPLEAYGHYWWLSTRLALDPDFGRAEIRLFLIRHQDTRLADQLRREWLKQLGKTHAWDVFSEQYVKFGGEDQEVACYSWQQRIERQDRESLGEAKAFWNSGKAAPEACDPVFSALLAHKRLSTGEVWARVRKLLESGGAQEVKRLAGVMPEIVNLPERMLALIGADPGRYLVRERLNVKSRPSVELGLYAMQRLARRDAPEAADWLLKRGAALPDEDKRFAWAQIGYHAAQQHEPRALEWYGKADGYGLSVAQAAWKVRAALRARDWPAVQSAIEAMPALDRREPAWRYWLARALKAQDRRAQADTLLQGLSGETNFYGLLAAEDLGVLAVPRWDGWRPQRADIDAVLARPAMRRAFLLYHAGLPGEGLYEWFSGVRGMDDKELLAAAEAASELGVPDRAIRAAERTVMLHDFSRRYPTPYRELLFASTNQSQLDEAWVYGLIKQESAFVADARSPVGAAGLMQLMPGTAKSMAKRASLKNFQLSRLTDVETNLTLGTQYLRHVLDDLGDAVLATAAYNAGPGRARRWRSEAPLEGAIYAESIPFEETRNYVKKVMANAFYYSSRLGAPKKSLKDMLGVVPGRSGKFRDAIASAGLQQLNAKLPENP